MSFDLFLMNYDLEQVGAEEIVIEDQQDQEFIIQVTAAIEKHI